MAAIASQTLTEQSIALNTSHLQATEYCLDLAMWAGNDDAVQRHADAIDGYRRVIGVLVEKLAHAKLCA